MKKITFLLSTIILVNQVNAEAKDPAEDQKVRLDQHFRKIPKNLYSSWGNSDELNDEIDASNRIRSQMRNSISNKGSTILVEGVFGAGITLGSKNIAKKSFKNIATLGTGVYLVIDASGRLYCFIHDLDAGFSPTLGVAGWTVREINEFFTDLPADYADQIKALKGELSNNKLADGVTLDDYFKSIDEVERNNTATVTGISGEIGVGALLVYKNFKNKAAADTLFKKAKGWFKIGAGVYAVYDGTSRVIAHIEDLDGGLSAASSMSSYLYGKGKEAAGLTPAPTKEPRKGKIESIFKGTVQEAEKTIKGDFKK